MDNYFDIPAESNSSLGWLYKSPRYYKWMKDTGGPEPTAAMNEGSVVHCLILEPDEFNKRYWMFNKEERPDRTKTMAAKENKEWAAELEIKNNGKEKITVEQHQNLQNVAQEVMRIAGDLIEAATEKEKIVLWEKTGIDMKAKIDGFHEDFLFDIKTTTNANVEAFQRKAFWDYQYHRQAAVYLDGASDGLFLGDKDFYFIAVEKTPPYLVSIHKVSDHTVALGMNQYLELLELLKECRRKNHWPHTLNKINEW